MGNRVFFNEVSMAADAKEKKSWSCEGKGEQKSHEKRQAETTVLRAGGEKSEKERNIHKADDPEEGERAGG